MPERTNAHISTRPIQRRGHLSASLRLSKRRARDQTNVSEVHGRLTAGRWRLIDSDDGYQVGQLAHAVDIRRIHLLDAAGHVVLSDVTQLKEADFMNAGCTRAEARYLSCVGFGFRRRPPLVFKLI